jgi:hypothetical protein
MEVADTSETSVKIYHITWPHIPEDGNLHSPCSENLKSHLEKILFCKTARFFLNIWSFVEDTLETRDSKPQKS